MNMRISFLETELFALWTKLESVKRLVKSKGQSSKFFAFSDAERAEFFKTVSVTGPMFEVFYKACYAKDAEVVESSFQKCAEDPELFDRIEAALQDSIHETA